MRQSLTLAAFTLLVAAIVGLPTTLQGQSTSSNDKSSRRKRGTQPTDAQKNSSKQTPAPGASQTDDRVRLQSKMVSLTVTVADANSRFVSGLRKHNFEVYDDGVKQEIAQFSDEDSPLTLGIIYDVSASMEDLTSLSFLALRRFFDASHEDDEYFIIAFNDRPHLVQDFTISPTEIMSPVMFVKADGNTALFDAVYLGVEKARQGRHPRKALLIISDGEENRSRYNGKELRNLLEEADVPVHAVGISSLSSGPRGPWKYFGIGTLVSLSNWSGGLTFVPGGEGETRDIYMQVAIMLRRQYVIGFYPTDAASSTPWHKVKVNLVKIPKGLGWVAVYSKSGYRGFGN